MSSVERTQVFKQIETHYRENSFKQVKKLQGHLGSYHNAEDAVQEAYTRACQYWRSYDPSLGFTQWFNGILTNCIRDKKKEEVLHGMAMESLEQSPPEPPTVGAVDRVYLQDVMVQIDAHPKPVAYVLRKYLFEGFNSEELSKLTAYSAPAIRKMVSRFREEYLVPSPA